MTGSNLAQLGLLRRRALRHKRAAPRVDIERPAMEAALHGIALMPPIGKRHSLVGAGIAQRESATAAVPS